MRRLSWKASAIRAAFGVFALLFAGCAGGGAKSDAATDATAGTGGGEAGGTTGGGGRGGNTAGTGGATGGNTAGTGGSTAGTGGSATAGTTGAGGTGGAGGGTGGTGGRPQLVIQNFVVYGNCQPVVPSDPIVVSWTSIVTGAASSNAPLVSATLTLTGFRTIIQALTVMPTAVPLTNGSGSATMRKTDGTPAAYQVCGEVCGSNARLDVFLEDGGTHVPIVATATGTYTCAL